MYSFKSLQPGASVTTTITTDRYISIGLFVFQIAHCGGSNQTEWGGYWDISVSGWDIGIRHALSVAYPKVWDRVNTATSIIKNMNASTYTTTYINDTTKTTDPNYNSSVRTKIIAFA